MLPEKTVWKKYHDELKKAAVHLYRYNEGRKHVQFAYYQSALARAKMLSIVLEQPLPGFERDAQMAYDRFAAKEGEKENANSVQSQSG